MSPEKTAFLFSGQGSQYAGMGVSLVEAYPELKKIFDEASEILGFDLYDKCANAPAEELAQTAISQPAIMAVSLCAAEALRINGITATAAAGHSLGEYAAITYRRFQAHQGKEPCNAEGCGKQQRSYVCHHRQHSRRY